MGISVLRSFQTQHNFTEHNTTELVACKGFCSKMVYITNSIQRKDQEEQGLQVSASMPRDSFLGEHTKPSQNVNQKKIRSKKDASRMRSNLFPELVLFCLYKWPYTKYYARNYIPFPVQIYLFFPSAVTFCKEEAMQERKSSER